VSIAQVGNDASERIMAKLGMRLKLCMRLERKMIDRTCDRLIQVQSITKTRYLAAGLGPRVGTVRPGCHDQRGGPIWVVSFLVSYIHVHRRPSACTAGR
jgi:hypothetical protein